MDFITPIKTELDAKLHEFSKKHLMLTGLSIADAYLPRWFNFDKYEDGKLYIKSSISSKGFYITVPEELQDDYFVLMYEHADFWQQFKAYRTEFLKNNYPNIRQFGI